MSMFDELEVDYPLPDGWDGTGEVFQTKDTPDQWLTRYRLTAEGVLVHGASGEVLPLDGPLTFYASNWSASGPWGICTRDDTPYWQAEYTATFAQRQLRTLTRARTVGAERPQLTRAEWQRCQDAGRQAHPPRLPGTGSAAAQQAQCEARAQRLLADLHVPQEEDDAD